MPVYCYSCKECEHQFEIRHSMSYDSQRCTKCDSCDVFKIPSLSLYKASSKPTQRTGKIVDDYIRDAKEEIKQEKHKLKSEEL